FQSGDVGAEHALQSGRRSRRAAQYLVDGPRSEPVSAGPEALRIEGADQRLQAAPLHQTVSSCDPAAGTNLRAGEGALERAWLPGASACSALVSSGVNGRAMPQKITLSASKLV